MRALGVAFYGSLCWAVVVGVVGPLLALAGVITLRDPTGLIVAGIGLGPFTLLVLGVFGASPFVNLYYLLTDDKAGGQGG